jgi:hypothetical protein
MSKRAYYMEMWRQFSMRSEGLEILRELFIEIKNGKEFH